MKQGGHALLALTTARYWKTCKHPWPGLAI